MKYAGYILIRSYLLHLGALAIFFALGSLVYSDFAANVQAKKEAYQKFLDEKDQLAEIRQANRGVAAKLNAYRRLIEEDQYSVMGDILRQHESNVGQSALRRSGFGVSAETSVFGEKSGHERTMIDVTYQGGFASIQEAFINLETLRPNIFLEELQIARQEAQPDLGYMLPYLEAKARYAVIGGKLAGQSASGGVPGLQQDTREWIPLDEVMQGMEASE